MARPVRRLVEYMRGLVVGAKGNVVSISLKKASRALGDGNRAEAAAVKAALDALASLGLLEAEDGKTRYVLRRGSPLWAALEAGHVELIAAVAAECSKQPRRRRRRPVSGGARGGGKSR
jgi:hypothetical protein